MADDTYKALIEAFNSSLEEDPVAQSTARFHRTLISNGIDGWTATMLTQTYIMTIVQHKLAENNSGGNNGSKDNSTG
jgi:hypothetical protein